ncbi:hypothetical protein [Hyphomicrobium sp. NDB2Meth4]|uniref:hypothetical protein n=1 Tax=Hyphomicrobium sp. NDB2Meth4 TaxID=1892846 RepID=UPI0009305085|nr:hypothetical protein [Hyphomicrobium sp. NDB2Meth4]
MPRDIDKYRHYFKEYDLSPEQERDIIEALYAIAETFADLAFGRHACQLLQPANDNDSMSNFNVVEFFEQSANDPVLEDYAEHLAVLEAEPKPKTKTTRS